MDDIEKISRDIVDLWERARIYRPDHPLRVFIDTRVYPVTMEESVEALRNENIKACFPDGSEYFHGLLVKGPDSAHTASPETLNRLNARIATMDLSPQRRDKFVRRFIGIWNIKEEE